MIPIMYLRRLFSSPPVPKVERVRWDRYNIASWDRYDTYYVSLLLPAGAKTREGA
jgi:hypothetical protein